MNLDLVNGTEQILGTVSNAAWSAGLQTDRAAFSLDQPMPQRRGGTTLIAWRAPTATAAKVPAGTGYGTATVSAAGTVTLSGVLSDNTTLFCRRPSGVSISNQWPLYIPLYGKLGSLSGWIDFTNGPSVLAGDAGWFRVGAYGKLYPAGFTNYPVISGSTFTNGTTRIPVLSQTNNLTAVVSGGGLGTNALANTVTLYNTGGS